jgi:hypothetical protein
MVNNARADMIFAALKLADISKVLYSQIGTDKPRNLKKCIEPITGFPAFGKEKVSNSKVVNELILKLVNEFHWKVIKKGNKIEGEENQEYFDNFVKKRDFMPNKNYNGWYFKDITALYVSPDDGLCIITYRIDWSDDCIYLTFTGNKVYDTSNMVSMSKEEKL